MNSQLAILGGPPAINRTLSPYKSMDQDEIKAVADVMQSGRISEFIGAWCDEFYGGPLIQEFEKLWCKEFKCKHAISVNSNTSGLIAAMVSAIFVMTCSKKVSVRVLRWQHWNLWSLTGFSRR